MFESIGRFFSGLFDGASGGAMTGAMLGTAVGVGAALIMSSPYLLGWALLGLIGGAVGGLVLGGGWGAISSMFGGPAAPETPTQGAPAPGGPAPGIAPPAPEQVVVPETVAGQGRPAIVAR